MFLLPAFLCGFIGLLAWIVKRFASQQRTYAPGPTGLPLLGNLLQLPKAEPWIHYARWARSYGDIYRFHVLGREFVVLSSITAALDLFERRSAIYSDRPMFVMCSELVGREDSVLFSQYGLRLREYRRILNATLGSGVVHCHLNMQREEVHEFIARLLETPGSLIPAIRRYAGSVVLRIAYGHRVTSDDDLYVQLAEELSQITAAAIQPGRWLVDSLPFLKHVPEWMPGAGFKTWASAARKRSNELIHSPLREVKQQRAEGIGSPSLVSEYLEKHPEKEDIISHVASSFYAAGADTTASILSTFFLMMVMHPDVQERAASEIERVVGKNRLPEFTDRETLPFTDALIKEVYRFHPVAPLIIHSPRKDDTYRQYFIPKGASVIVNVWGILHDEKNFPDPDLFNPDRFMNALGKDLDPRAIIFGLGRRNCPGKYLGEASIFLAISTSLATLRVSKFRDADGKTVEPRVKFTSGHTSQPFPFPYRIEPRTSHAVQLLNQYVPHN
ncbi:cytochrome P450 [Favolaschia claudopus]|uniref:Cytochrome P450 n=1 Tax=Favolaschia claudopus TaxID=2862362 RepID=A0AAV9ZSQ3_9AGAR